METLFRSLRKNDPTVTRIDMQKYRSLKGGKNIAKKLGIALQHNDHVVALDSLRLSLLLPCEKDNDHDMVLSFLRESKSLRTVKLDNDTGAHDKNKNDDDTNDTTAQSHFLDRFLYAMAESTTVVELHLSGFKFTAASCLAFCHFLQTTKSVHTLALVKCDCSAWDEKTMLGKVTRALEDNRSVKILQLKAIEIRELSMFVRSTTMLSELSIESVKLNKSAMDSLISAISSKSSLKSLCLVDSYCGFHSTDSLRSYLLKCISENTNTLNKLVLMGYIGREFALPVPCRVPTVASVLQVLHIDGFHNKHQFFSLFSQMNKLQLRSLHLGSVTRTSCNYVGRSLATWDRLEELSLTVYSWTGTTGHFASAMSRNASLRSFSMHRRAWKTKKRLPMGACNLSIFTPAEYRAVQGYCQRNGKLWQFLRQPRPPVDALNEGWQDSSSTSSTADEAIDKDLDVIHFPSLLRCTADLMNQALRRRILLMGLIKFGVALGCAYDGKRISLPS